MSAFIHGGKMKPKFLSISLSVFLLLITSSCVDEQECQEPNANNTVGQANCQSDDQPIPGEQEDNPGDETPPDAPPTTPPDTPPTTPPDVPKEGEPTETNKESFFNPWNKSNTSIVIDAYEGNSINWDLMKSDTKMVGVIHRSSIGLRVDSKYQSRKAIAKSRGYLWGAYHLGYRGNTIKQADLFLGLINGEEDTLMVLDLENTTNGTFMPISEAITFMEYIFEKTGRIPVVYANHSTTKLLNSRVAAHPLFQQSKLWYARFKSNVTDFPFGVWNNYFLWQFSSEINCNTTGNCLYNVPGTRFDMDVNVFFGNKNDIRARWHND